MKYRDQKQLGAERVYLANTYHITIYYQRESGEELKQDKNLDTEADAEDMEGCCLLSCSTWLDKLTFFLDPGPPAQGDSYTTNKYSCQHKVQPRPCLQHSFCVLTCRNTFQKILPQRCWCPVNHHQCLKSSYSALSIPKKQRFQFSSSCTLLITADF